MKTRVIDRVEKIELSDNGTFFAISEPNGDGTNHVYNVGSEKYIRKVWQTKFKSPGFRGRP